MAISTGWTLDYVGWHVDLPRLGTLNKYWKKFPPVHVLVASYVGYEAPADVDLKPEEVKASQEDMMQEFMASIPTRAFQKPVVKHGDGSEPRTSN